MRDNLINNYSTDLIGERSSMYMSLKTQILNHDQKDLLKRALFFYQKDACEHQGSISDEDKGLIESIIDTLHMKHI